MSAGRCKHRPLQRFATLPGSHVPGWPRALPPFVGADSISARGVCAAARSGGVRAPRPTSARVAAAVPVAPNIKFVRRGGIYPARGCLCGRNVPGTMQASSPTEVCYNAGARFPGWPLCFPLLRRAGVYARRTAANSKNMFRRPFFQRPPCGGVKPLPCRARQTLYRQETNAFLNSLTHPQNGWVFYARRRALVFRHGSR